MQPRGATPLAHMLEVMRSPDRSPEERMEAAKAAAPFVHPRLTAIEHKGEFNHHYNQEDVESARRKLNALMDKAAVAQQ